MNSKPIYATFQELREIVLSLNKAECDALIKYRNDPKRWRNFAEKIVPIIESIEAIDLQDSDFQERVARIRHDMEKQPTCLCGNPIRYKSGKFTEYCSHACSTKYKQKSGPQEAVIVDGVEYDSVSDAVSSTGIIYQTLINRIFDSGDSVCRYKDSHDEKCLEKIKSFDERLCDKSFIENWNEEHKTYYDFCRHIGISDKRMKMVFLYHGVSNVRKPVTTIRRVQKNEPSIDMRFLANRLNPDSYANFEAYALDFLKTEIEDENRSVLYDVYNKKIAEFLAEKYPEIVLETDALTNKYRAGVFLFESECKKEPVCMECGASLREAKNVKDSQKNRISDDRNAHYWIWPQFCSIECSTKSKATQEKREATFLEKYGFKNAMMNPEISNKVTGERDKNIYKKMGVQQSKKALLDNGILPELYAKLHMDFSDPDKCKEDAQVICEYAEQLGQRLGRDIYRFDICEHGGIHKTTLNRIFQRSPEHIVLYRSPKNVSRGALEVHGFVEDLIGSGKTIPNDRNCIAPMEIDIYIPEKNVGIEYHGIWCHSEGYGERGERYHVGKTIMAEENGVKLLQIYDIEWNDPIKRKIWKSIISIALGKVETKIHARKCEIVSVDPSEARKFMNENHLSGFVGASSHIGLKYNDELVMVGSFGKSRFDESHEVIRVASSLNTIVVGGMSKIIKEYAKSHKGEILMTYSNRRHSSSLNCAYGKMFERLPDTQPNYLWFNKNYKEIYSRYQTQKHKLQKILGEWFDPNKSERENMFANGYDRIWDCGNLKYRMIM